MNALAAEPVTRHPACRAAALLVDGENLPAALAGQLIAAARARLGTLAVLRVYGDATRLNGWAEAPGYRFVQAQVLGKSAADMALAVEAMELALAGRIDGLAIASNDRDFTPLVWALRQHGLPVLGLITRPEGLARSIAALAAVERIALPEPAAPLPALPPSPPEDPRLAAIRAVLKTPLSPASFGHAMNRAGFCRPAGAARWQGWLRNHAPFVRITGTGADTRFQLA